MIDGESREKERKKESEERKREKEKSDSSGVERPGSKSGEREAQGCEAGNLNFLSNSGQGSHELASRPSR